LIIGDSTSTNLLMNLSTITHNFILWSLVVKQYPDD